MYEVGVGLVWPARIAKGSKHCRQHFRSMERRVFREIHVWPGLVAVWTSVSRKNLSRKWNLDWPKYSMPWVSFSVQCIDCDYVTCRWKYCSQAAYSSIGNFPRTFFPLGCWWRHWHMLLDPGKHWPEMVAGKRLPWEVSGQTIKHQPYMYRSRLLQVRLTPSWWRQPRFLQLVQYRCFLLSCCLAPTEQNIDLAMLWANQRTATSHLIRNGPITEQLWVSHCLIATTTQENLSTSEMTDKQENIWQFVKWLSFQNKVKHWGKIYYSVLT